MDAETKLLALLELAGMYQPGPDGKLPPEARKAMDAVLGGGMQFGMVGDEWHGPKPPGDPKSWVKVGEGERGGLIWKRSGTSQRPTNPVQQPQKRGPSIHEEKTSPPPDIHEQGTRQTPSPKKQAPQEPEDAWSQPTRPATTQSLAGTPKRLSPMKGSANVVYRAEMPDGSQGIFKPSEGEDADLRKNIEAGTYWKREVASSRLAEAVGMGGMVPVTVPTKVGGQDGSMQAFVPNAKTGMQVAGRGGNPFGEDPEAVNRAAVFDFVTGNSDRHAGNWMLDNQGKIHLIDNGLSFPDSDDEQNYFNAHLLRRAVRQGAVVPDVSAWVAAWPKIEKELSGIEPQALQLAKGRLDLLTANAGKPLADLPSPINGHKSLGLMLETVRHRPLPQSQLPKAEFTSAPAEQPNSNEPTKKS